MAVWQHALQKREKRFTDGEEHFYYSGKRRTRRIVEVTGDAEDGEGRSPEKQDKFTYKAEKGKR